MFKYIIIMIFLILLPHCSSNHFPINYNEDNTNNISNLSFDYNLSFEQFKKNVIKYGELSNYPRLDKNE